MVQIKTRNQRQIIFNTKSWVKIVWGTIRTVASNPVFATLMVWKRTSLCIPVWFRVQNPRYKLVLKTFQSIPCQKWGGAPAWTNNTCCLHWDSNREFRTEFFLKSNPSANSAMGVSQWIEGKPPRPWPSHDATVASRREIAYSRLLKRIPAKKKTPPGGGVSFDHCTS